jgi:hypothetical protein
MFSPLPARVKKIATFNYSLKGLSFSTGKFGRPHPKAVEPGDALMNPSVSKYLFQGVR